jgi:hypothetical protein
MGRVGEWEKRGMGEKGMGEWESGGRGEKGMGEKGKGRLEELEATSYRDN